MTLNMSKESGKPSPDLIRTMILKGFTVPVIFRNLNSDWKPLSWSLKDWCELFGSKPLQFRRGETDASKWEGECEVLCLTMAQFVQSQESDSREVPRPPVEKLDHRWLYLDYKHLPQLFEEDSDIMSAISWAALGFPERGARESTLWIGSKGAYTPCHKDSYGSNLVAQVYGRKRWTLLPPDTPLHPTRVPYEESSVYSMCNLHCPNPCLAEALGGAYEVTLSPGDILFVPHHWWHYVENVETAISINTWVPLKQDHEARVDEALVRLLVSQLSKECPVEQRETLLSPTEADIIRCPLSDSLKLLEMCIARCRSAQCAVKEADSQTPPPVFQWEEFPEYICPVPHLSASELRDCFSERGQDQAPKFLSVPRPLGCIMNALCDPEVIAGMRKRLLEEL